MYLLVLAVACGAQEVCVQVNVELLVLDKRCFVTDDEAALQVSCSSNVLQCSVAVAGKG